MTMSGSRLGRPRRPRIGGIASTSGMSWVMSVRLSPVSLTASGIRPPSQIRGCLEPVLTRSTGLDPVAAPTFRRTWDASTHARDQSTRLAAFSSATNVRCSWSNTRAACQSHNRRQHVIPEPKPSSRGRSSQPIPVNSTNRIPCPGTRPWRAVGRLDSSVIPRT